MRKSACSLNHDLVARLARDGATLEAIGKAVGTTKNRVRQYLTQHHIQRAPWREPPPGAHPMARNTSGSLNPAWKGGRMQDKDGY